ncbi:MAG TPA: nitrile hydratase accessory protein [Acidimicrobiales bacterium]|nr:nitrile hydratase accessory protein [Acidimicrobiales bacterium]
MAPTAPTAVLDVDGPAAPPRSNGELVFAEPWESRAFGLAMALNAGGVFEWEDFRRQLIAAVAEAEREPDAEASWSYYRCWLVALERVLAAAGVVSTDQLLDRARALEARPAGHDHDHDHDGGHGHDHG